MRAMKLTIELDREEDGRWIAEIRSLPGVLAHGVTRKDALAAVKALALHVVADRLENGEAGATFKSVTFVSAPVRVTR